MSDYATLQADIANWLARDDLTATIPTLISLAEERHRWGMVAEPGKRNPERGAIRVRSMERRARIDGNDTPYLPLPPNMLEHRSLQFVGSTQRDRDLVFVVKGDSMEFNQNHRPTRYTITRDEFEFNGNTSTSHEFECIYYEPFAVLSAENVSNWLSLNAYACYLFGALAEAADIVRNDELIAKWELKYAGAVSGLMASEHRARRDQGALRVVMSGRSTP